MLGGASQEIRPELVAPRLGLQDAFPVPVVVEGIPPAPGLQSPLPELVSRSIAGRPPARAFHHADPGLVELGSHDGSAPLLVERVHLDSDELGHVLPGKRRRRGRPHATGQVHEDFARGTRVAQRLGEDRLGQAHERVWDAGRRGVEIPPFEEMSLGEDPVRVERRVVGNRCEGDHQRHLLDCGGEALGGG